MKTVKVKIQVDTELLKTYCTSQKTTETKNNAAIGFLAGEGTAYLVAMLEMLAKKGAGKNTSIYDYLTKKCSKPIKIKGVPGQFEIVEYEITAKLVEP